MFLVGKQRMRPAAAGVVHAEAVQKERRCPMSVNNNKDKEDDVSSYYFFLSSPMSRYGLLNYEYKGEDRSLLYKYALSPLALFCVNRLTPKSVAPNSITLAGLLCMATAYVVEWYHVPTVYFPADDQEPSEPLPRWIFLLNGIAMLIYQTLDNMDGKQARRTGSGSPLGMLFDHGCDAVNNLFGCTNWIIAMGLLTKPEFQSLNDWVIMVIVFGPLTMFLMGTWEEYYTDELVLGILNGPSEGLLGGACLSFTSWWYGPEYWQQHDWYEMLPASVKSIGAAMGLPETPIPRNCDVLILGCCFLIIFDFGSKVINVTQVYGKQTVKDLLPFLGLVFCFVSVHILTVGCGAASLWLDNPRTSLHLCSGLFVEMVTALMLAHMTKQDYQQYRWIMMPLVVLTAVLYFVPEQKIISLQRWLSLREFLLIYTTAVWVYVVLKITFVFNEICSLLNIWCFDITTPRRPQSEGAAVTNGHHRAAVTNGHHHHRPKNE